MYTQPIISPYPISDFLEWRASEQLEITPTFQRRQVWQPKARSYLIDTILRQMPIPPLYIRTMIDLEKQRTIRQVVDGQQRLRAIFDYIKGDFKVLKVHNAEYADMTFPQMPTDIQKSFLSYKLAVNALENLDDSQVYVIFARLNTYTVPLNKQELRNAQFFGAFKQAVYDLASRHLTFWRNNNILREPQIARMNDAELVSELLVTMLDGFRDTQDKDLKRFYDNYDDEFLQSDEYVKRFEKTIDVIKDILGDDLAHTVFRRVPLFFSLFIVIYDALYGLPGQKSQRLTFSKKQTRIIHDNLIKLSGKVQSKTPEHNYLPFIEAAGRATANVKNRVVRHNYIWKVMEAY